MPPVWPCSTHSSSRVLWLYRAAQPLYAPAASRSEPSGQLAKQDTMPAAHQAACMNARCDISASASKHGCLYVNARSHAPISLLVCDGRHGQLQCMLE